MKMLTFLHLIRSWTRPGLESINKLGFPLVLASHSMLYDNPSSNQDGMRNDVSGIKIDKGPRMDQYRFGKGMPINPKPIHMLGCQHAPAPRSYFLLNMFKSELKGENNNAN